MDFRFLIVTFTNSRSTTRMLRGFVAGLTLLIGQATPASAETITLACSYGSQYVTRNFTVDTVAKTVKDFSGTHRALITGDSVVWEGQDGVANRYDRHAATYCGWLTNSDTLCTRYMTPGMEGTPKPVPCVASPHPF